MATSSIPKEFVAKDPEAFQRLKEAAEKAPERKITATESSSLSKGREALRKFSFR